MKHRLTGFAKKLLARDKTLTKKLNLISAHIQFRMRKVYLSNYPTRLFIDPSNYCNLQCSLCPVGTKAKGREQGLMSLDTFRKIIAECGPYLWEIELYNWGEPLLNPDILTMIEEAKRFKIDVNISSNLNHLSDEVCIGLVDMGVDKLIISLDGASQESVEKYQTGNNFQLAMQNIKRLVDQRNKAKSKKPFIQWRFVVNRFNESEIEKARQLSNELGVDNLELCGFRCDMGKELLLSDEAQYENAKPWLPVDESLAFYDYTRKRKKVAIAVCKRLWLESVVHPDGSISPCCAVWHDKFDFGNINTSSFHEIWNNSHYQNARRISRGDNIAINEHICHICKINNATI